jgi:hypothetical protein
MNSPVPLLNEYQLPLLEDKDAFAVLAFLLREGTSTDDEISRVTNLPSATVQAIKMRLFRARLVRLCDSTKISLTDRSTELLVKFELTQSMVDAISIEKTGSRIWSSLLKPLVASDQVPFQKQLRFRVAQYLARALAEDAGEECRFLTASAVGMQDDISKIPWETLADLSPRARREIAPSNTPSDLILHFAGHGAPALKHPLQVALSDLNATRAALDKDLEFPSDGHQRRTVKFVILDACASAMTQLDVPSAFLQSAFHNDQSLPARLWNLWTNDKVVPILQEAVSRFRAEHLYIDLDFSKSSVPDLLGSVLMEQTRAASPAMHAWWKRALFRAAQSPADFEVALTGASELKQFIESDTFARLPESEQRRLQVRIQEISAALTAQMRRSYESQRE